MAANVATPAASLVITRRLSLVIRRSNNISIKKEVSKAVNHHEDAYGRRKNRDGICYSISSFASYVLWSKWLYVRPEKGWLISTPLTIFQDYVVQANRFSIFEEFGCSQSVIPYGLSFLLLNSMPILFPLISLTLYSRKCWELRSVYQLTLISHSEINHNVLQAQPRLGRDTSEQLDLEPKCFS